MNKQILFKKVCNEFENKLIFLDDKPEETLQSTIKALWFKAIGIAVSAEKAAELELPDITTNQVDELYNLIQARTGITPLAHITGRQSFMGIDMLSDRRAMIPRKETEILGRKALEISREISSDSIEEIHVMDVCCGAGNLGLAIAYYNPKCKVFSSDITQDAVDLTQDNINLLNLDCQVNVRQGDLLSPFENDQFFEYFDLIICNPPYISSNKASKMNPEISNNEPIEAFDGGIMGIKIIQKFLSESPKFLKEMGWIALEVGAGQGIFILQLCERSESFSHVGSVSDSSDQIRVVYAQKTRSA